MSQNMDAIDARPINPNEIETVAQQIEDNVHIHDLPPPSNAEHEPDAKGSSGLGFFNPFSNKKYIQLPTERYATEYNMGHPSRGIAFIFNQKNFNPRFNLKKRNGTDNDRDNFKQALMSIGFEEKNIKVFDDRTHKQINDELKDAALMDHTNNDCIVVAVFTHGDLNCLYATDRKFNPEELWEPFTADKCSSLAGKPKLFFIQACQGDRLDNGLSFIDQTDGREQIYKIPIFADFLMYYSTVPGFYSWRNTSDGSWFIQALCQVLIHYGKKYDLLTLLTLVNQMVAMNFESNVPDNPQMDKKKQIPCFSSMLTRKVYFAPRNGPQ